MSDENLTPIEAARKAADALNLTGDDREDFIEMKMRRAGFKKGPGEWIDADSDDGPKDDDDTPMTRGEWRAIQREQRRKSANPPAPPKKDNGGTPPTQTPPKNSGWWKDYS